MSEKKVCVTFLVTEKQREEWKAIAAECEQFRGKHVPYGNMLLEAAYLGLPLLVSAWDKEKALGLRKFHKCQTDLDRGIQVSTQLLRNAWSASHALGQSGADDSTDGATQAGSSQKQ